MEDILVDYWAHLHADDPKLRSEDVSSDFEGDIAAFEADEGIPSDGAGAPPDPGDFADEIAEEYGGLP